VCRRVGFVLPRYRALPPLALAGWLAALNQTKIVAAVDVLAPRMPPSPAESNQA